MIERTQTCGSWEVGRRRGGSHAIPKSSIPPAALVLKEESSLPSTPRSISELVQKDIQDDRRDLETQKPALRLVRDGRDGRVPDPNPGTAVVARKRGLH